jgi:NTE family protein
MLRQSIGSGIQYLFSIASLKRQKIHKILNEMQNAYSYTNWKELALRLDQLNGHDKWRKDNNSTLYDGNVLLTRTRDIQRMIDDGNVFDLMFRLRGGLSRDQYGIQNKQLFMHASAGTKHLVEDYNNTVINALNYICDADSLSGREEVRYVYIYVYMYL